MISMIATFVSTSNLKAQKPGLARLVTSCCSRVPSSQPYLSLLPVWTLKDQASLALISALVRLDPPSGSRDSSDNEDQHPEWRDCESSERLTY